MISPRVPGQARSAQLRTVINAGPLYCMAVDAATGIWYDAIASIGGLIEQSPDDASLRTQRAALQEQIGLKDAAAADRQRQQ